jgi:hypothetical protein|tara:strand:+ start:9666 stop:9827 length:162 start_codon:yes stop_codon:yes gene_type:complete
VIASNCGLQTLRKAFGLDDIRFAARADLVIEELAQGFECEVLPLKLLMKLLNC